MAFFGKKGFAQRIATAVDPSLEPGEHVEVSFWTRDPSGDLSRAVFGLLVEARVASFILTLTDRRVIGHTPSDEVWREDPATQAAPPSSPPDPT